MRGRVVAHGRFADLRVHDGCHDVANLKVLTGLHFVKTNSLNGHITSQHIGPHNIPLGVVQPADVSDLAARVSVERCAIKDNLTCFARVQLSRKGRVGPKNASNYATSGASVQIALKEGGCKVSQFG